MDPDRIPRDADDRAARWRAETAARDVVVVLDNVDSVEQVRPLLPGGAGPVLLTSRRRLVGLGGADVRSLDVMTPDDAVDFFVRIAGPDRTSDQDDDVARAVARCGRLPLAIRLAATRLRHRPAWSVADMVARLGGGPEDATAAAFTVSFQQLAAPTRTLFRLLGLHPGPDIDLGAAAALAGRPASEVERDLEELLDAHLVEQHRVGRYALHDLLRAYAAERAAADETASARTAAITRMVDFYLHAAYGAGSRSYATHPSWPFVSTDPLPGDTDPGDPLAWFSTEHPVLLAMVGVAAAEGLDTRTWQLAGTLAGYLLQAGRWREWGEISETALDASRRTGDRRGEAHAHHWLGQLHRSEGRHPSAHDHLVQALDRFRALGMPTLASHALLDIALTYGEQQNHEAAVEYSRAGLDLSRAIGDRAGTARALNSLGWYLLPLGRSAAALVYCEQALDLARAAGNVHVEASTLDSIGYIHFLLTDYERALRYFEESLAARRAKGDYFLQADALTKLGDTHLALSATDAARTHWQEALTILEGLQHRDARAVRTRLLALAHSGNRLLRV